MNSSVAGYGSTTQLATQDSNATTAAITNALKFATSKSVRTSTIILASFNALAAFATAVGIIHGCRTYRKTVRRLQRKTSEPPSGLFFISTVEVFPLVLCFSITIQSIIFAAAQSVGLQALLSRGCALVAVAVLPAVFIVPITHLVFGLETAARGIRTQFAPRGRWNVTICLGFLTGLTLAAVLVAAINRSSDFCFASLFWFIRKYARGCFVLLTVIGVAMLVAIGIIFFKLNRSRLVDPIERTSATRMIYYLCLGFLSNSFLLPFFFSLTFLDQQKVIWQTLNLSMVASVVSNVNGLMVAGLHLFLKSQSNSKLRKNFDEYEQKQFYSDDPRGPRRSLRRSSLSLQLISNQRRGRSDSNVTLLRADADDSRSPKSAVSYGTTTRPPFSPKLFIPSGPKYPEPTQPPSEVSPSQIRKQSYSIFPREPYSAASGVLPAATYSPETAKPPSRDTYKPPPIVKPWLGRGHKRDSSVGSTATVQIGIRISNVNDFVPRKSTDTEAPPAPEMPSVATMPSIPQSNLSNSVDVDDRSVSEYDSDPEIVLSNPPRKQSVKDSRMKTLPPVPKSPAVITVATNSAKAAESSAQDKNNDEEQLITLSPSVYTPQEGAKQTSSPTKATGSAAPQRSLSNRSDRSGKKIPSPKGVGFNNPNGNRSPSGERHALHAPPRPGGGGSAASTPLPGTKADWI